jgi:hypothetical protein
MKSDHIYHGDPRFHADEITALKVRIRQLEAEKKDLEQALQEATTREQRSQDWRMRGW